jgi:PAS domain S-box-containing protein
LLSERVKEHIKMDNPHVSLLDAELAALGGDLSSALEELPVPAAVLDTEGIVRWQNEASRKQRGEIVGTAFADLVGDKDLQRYHELLKQILCRGEPAEFTLSIQDPQTGGLVPVEVSSSPIRDGGSVVGVFGLGRTISEAAAPELKPKDASAPPLTERQLDVLRLLAEGSSTQQIATALSLSPTTVRNYIARILAALEVHTRLQAVVAARRRGLI